MARVYVVILCISVVIAQRSSTSSLRRKPAITELKELERQNRITQQIFANYVERRLFPHRPPKQKPPTIDDILPKTPTKTLRLIRNNSSEPNGNDSPDYDNLDTKGDPLFDDDFDDRDGDSEALQTVESNQHQYYPDGFTADPAENEVESGHSKRIRGLFTVLENIASYNAFKSKQERFRQQIEPSYQEQYDNSYTSDGNYENRFEKRDQDLYDNRSENDESDDDDSYESSRYENRQSANSQYEASRHQNSQSSNRQHYEQQSKSPFEDRIEEIDYGGPNNETLLTELENFVYSRFHCPNCVDDSQFSNRWTMPLLKLGEKRYYLGIFFKANWFKAAQYCRFHGMHLASISSQEENDRLEKHIRDFGLGHEHFWTSGTDLADEGHFFWMANGRPITFTNWNAGEPNNFRYENGEEENCLELWNRDGKGLKWNDSPCSFETYFVCEVQ